LLVICAIIVLTRPKQSLMVGLIVGVVVSGMIVFNPGGFADTVQTMGRKVF
jgi:hypothetical protein